MVLDRIKKYIDFKGVTIISNSAVSTAGPAINTVGQHSVELQTENHHLQQRIADLERLLDEKERLISILLSKQ